MKHRPEGISNADGFWMLHRRLMMFRAEVTMNSSAVNGTLGLYINSLMLWSVVTSEALADWKDKKRNGFCMLLFSSVLKPIGDEFQRKKGIKRKSQECRCQSQLSVLHIITQIARKLVKMIMNIVRQRERERV